MKTYKELSNASKSLEKTVVLFFCECNPPTLNHLVAFTATKQIAEKQNADYAIILSNNRSKLSGPLTVTEKLEYTNLFFPGFNIVIASENINTSIDVARVYNKNYKNLIEVCGIDKVKSYSKIHECANNDVYQYSDIKVVSTGEIDPDNSQSSTKLKKAILEGDVKSVQKHLLAHVREIDARRFMNDCRKGMGLDPIKETISFTTSDLRERYVAGEIFIENTFVTSDNQLYKIINRNNNYLTVLDNSGILSKKWLTNVQPIEVSEAIRIEFEGIREMKFSSSDKIKVGKIIGGMLGADVSKGSNAEQMVNAGLRITRNRTLNAEAIEILQNMLKTADEAGILYDKKLVPVSVQNEDNVQVSADVMPRKIDPLTGEYGRLQHKRRLVFNRSKRVNTIDGTSMVGKTAGNGAGPFESVHEDADSVISSGGDQSLAKIGTMLDIPQSKEEKPKKSLKNFIKSNESIDEAKRRDHEQEHIDSIRARTEQAHAKGQRYHTLYVKDQVIADTHHLHLNSLGGKQVQLHPGTSVTTHESANECTIEELESTKDGSNITDAEIDDMISHVNDWDDIVGLYDSSELSYVDADNGTHVADVADKFFGYEGDPTETPDDREIDAPDDVFVAGPPKMRESELHEIVSRVERIKTGVIHHASMIKRPIKVALKHRSNVTQITRRAHSLAVKTLKLNLAGKPLKQLTRHERDHIDHIVTSKTKLIHRIALRLMPKIRKIEQNRMSHANFTKD